MISVLQNTKTKDDRERGRRKETKQMKNDFFFLFFFNFFYFFYFFTFQSAEFQSEKLVFIHSTRLSFQYFYDFTSNWFVSLILLSLSRWLSIDLNLWWYLFGFEPKPLPLPAGTASNMEHTVKSIFTVFEKINSRNCQKIQIFGQIINQVVIYLF